MTHSRRIAHRGACLAIALLAFAAAASAEVEQSGELCGNTMCFYWWPKLPPLKGWHHEEGISKKQGINALAPDGSTFGDATTVMYAAALRKSGGDMKSIDELIESDKKAFMEHAPDSVVTEIAPLTTGDGQKLRTLTFIPKDSGNWEHVSFGDEGEYFLVFTVSSRSKEELEKALPAYQSLISRYKVKL